MPRDPQHDIPSPSELRAKIRELGKKLGVEDREDDAPSALPEHWPGGPNIFMNDPQDFRLAKGKKRRGGDTLA